MTTMTFSVPEDMRNKMKLFPEINWSEVARQAFNKKLQDLEFLQEFKAKSTMTEKDALKFGAEINKRISEKYSKKR